MIPKCPTELPEAGSTLPDWIFEDGPYARLMPCVCFVCFLSRGRHSSAAWLRGHRRQGQWEFVQSRIPGSRNVGPPSLSFRSMLQEAHGRQVQADYNCPASLTLRLCIDPTHSELFGLGMLLLVAYIYIYIYIHTYIYIYIYIYICIEIDR